MQETVRVVVIPYLISPSKDRVVYNYPWRLGLTIDEAIRLGKAHLDKLGVDRIHISCQGYPSSPEQELLPSDMIIISSYQGAPAIAGLLVTYAGTAATTAMVVANIAVAVLTIGAGLLISSIMSPTIPESPGSEKATYGWGGMQNMNASGLPVPVAYGELWSAPPIIGGYRTVDEDYNMWQFILFALSAGKTNNVITADRVRIGEELLTSYDNYVFAATDGDTTVGASTVTTLSNFPDTKHDFSYDRRLRYDPRANAVGVCLLNFNTAIWSMETTFLDGDYVLPTVVGDYCYECTTAGDTDITEPVWGTTPGGTTSDGTVVWTCRALASPSDWTANTAKISGDYVTSTVSNGYWYECTTPGTTHATTEPTWGTVVGGTTSDGVDVVWTCRTAKNLPVLDSSGRGSPWTKYGQAEVKLDSPKWGNGYIDLPGEGDYLSTDDYETLLMSRPVQFEFWVKFPDYNNRCLFYTTSTETEGEVVTVTRVFFGYLSSQLYFQSSQVKYEVSNPPAGGVDSLQWSVIFSSSEDFTPTLDTWYYIKGTVSSGHLIYTGEMGAPEVTEGDFKIQVEDDLGDLVTLMTDKDFYIANNDARLSDAPEDYSSLSYKSYYNQYIGYGKYVLSGVPTEIYGLCSLDCIRITRGTAYDLTVEGTEDVVPTEEITTNATTDFAAAFIIQTQSKCDHVKIILEFREGLGHVSSNTGKTSARSVEFSYHYRVTGTSTWTESTIVCGAERLSSVPRFEFQLDLPSRDFYDILLVRKTSDHDNEDNTKDSSWLVSFQEILDLQQLYPGIQVMALGVKASDKVSGTLGTVVVKHQRTLITVPTWDNSSTQEVDPSVPAWQMFDACTNRLYGIKQTPSDLKRTSFEDWEEWTEALVVGNRRATCNVVYDELSNFADGFLRNIEQCGRMRILREGSLWKPVVDKPRISQYVFSAGNILPSSKGSKDSSCSWSGYDETEKVDAVTVTWWDADKYGVKKTTALAKASWYEELSRLPKVQNVELRGCNNEDEANRHARYRINKNEHITMQGSHKAGAQCSGIEFGDVFTLLPSSYKSVWGGNLARDHTSESALYVNGEVNLTYPSGETETSYLSAAKLFAVGTSGEYCSYSISSISGNVIEIVGSHSGNRGDTVGIGRLTEDRLTQQVTKVSHNFSAREVSFEWCTYSDDVFYYDDWPGIPI